MPDLDALLAEADALCEAATEGPWETFEPGGYGRSSAVRPAHERHSFTHISLSHDADAEFIARARTLIPELCEALRRLRAAEGMSESDALTDDEHEAMRLSGELARLLHRIIGDGPQAANDWSEAAQRIHAVQHMIMAQAAARAYPSLYRLLGGRIEL